MCNLHIAGPRSSSDLMEEPHWSQMFIDNNVEYLKGFAVTFRRRSYCTYFPKLNIPLVSVLFCSCPTCLPLFPIPQILTAEIFHAFLPISGLLSFFPSTLPHFTINENYSFLHFSFNFPFSSLPEK